MDISRTIAAIILVAVASGCSVKEDRWPCPCRLTVELSDGIRLKEAGPVGLSVWSDENGKEVEATLNPEDYPSGYRVEVTKGEKHVSAIVGRKNCTLEGNVIQGTVGNEFDKIYIHSSEVACLSEEARDTIRLHKAFAEIAVELVDPTNAKRTFGINTEYTNAGLDILTCTPAGGAVSIPLKSDSERESGYVPVQKIDTTGRSNRLFRFICPRQKDYKMVLSLYDGAGKKVNSIRLGELLHAAGYSWETADLKDAFVRIDRTDSGVTLQINDWITGEKKDITI